MACCTNNAFRLFRDGTQVKSIGSRSLAGVYVTDGIVYYISSGGTLYSMAMDTYTESTLATFSVPASPASNTRLYASFCTFNGDIHFVISFRYNATTNTPIKLYKYDAENGAVFIKDVIASAANLPADVLADGENMYVIYNYNRGDNRIYRCDAEYNVSFYEYAFFLKNNGQNNTSCIIKGNKYPLAMRGNIISLWNASMPVNISLTHFSGHECAAVSAEINGDCLYLATFGRNGDTGVLRVHRLNKDYFDNFFDCKANNEMYIKNVSELKYGQTGIMSYHGRVFEYSSGTGTGLRNRYAPFGMKDLYKVKATGTSYRKYMLISQGQCQHIARVFTAQADENIYHSTAFRIPTICEYNGVLYAACSARLSGAADSSPANTVVARSFDGGVTWQDYGTATTRLDGGSDVDGNIHVCRGGSHAGRLWVFANRYDNTSLTKNENYQFIGCYSDDGGLTWSEPINYLPAVIAAAAEAGYTISYCRTGNGSGVTLANGTLAISIGLYVSGRQAAALWYTTDGENWQLGDILPNDESNESALALVGNEIYMTYRMNSNRGFAKLSSIGSGWTKITTATNPNGNSSNLTVGWGYCNGVFLLSCPYNSNRNNLTLYKSRDLVTWTRVIQFTSSNTSAANLQGYTCMVFTQDMLKIFAEMKENDQNVFDFDYLLPSIFS